jgi:hypothetical protein
MVVRPLTRRCRIFVYSPGDVKAAREIAALTIERLAQDYARSLDIEPYLWEFEAMVASGHFQDSIEPPSAFDVVVLIVWSRLGTSLPERTVVREYRGIDARTPVTGIEWEFEEALQGAQKTGAPDLLVYRSHKPTPVDSQDRLRREQQLQQLRALDGFWERHFANRGMFIGAYTAFESDAEFAAAFEVHLRKLIERRIAALGSARGDAPTRAWAQAPFRGLEAYEFPKARKAANEPDGSISGAFGGSTHVPEGPFYEMPDTVAARLSSRVICCCALVAPAQAFTITIRSWPSMRVVTQVIFRFLDVPVTLYRTALRPPTSRRATSEDVPSFNRST